VLYLCLEYGKRFVQNYNDLLNDTDEKLSTSDERKEILDGFDSFLHGNLSKIVLIITARIKLKEMDTKILKLNDTISVCNGILEWKPFNDWGLSHKHYLLCFLGNLIQGV